MNEEEVYLIFYMEDCITLKPVCVFESDEKADWFVKKASTKEVEFEVLPIKLVKGGSDEN